MRFYSSCVGYTQDSILSDYSSFLHKRDAITKTKYTRFSIYDSSDVSLNVNTFGRFESIYLCIWLDEGFVALGVQ